MKLKFLKPCKFHNTLSLISSSTPSLSSALLHSLASHLHTFYFIFLRKKIKILKQLNNTLTKPKQVDATKMEM